MESVAPVVFRKLRREKGHNLRIADFGLRIAEATISISLLCLGSGCFRDLAAPVAILRKNVRQPLKQNDLARSLKLSIPVAMIEQQP
jgi:hypothetical protein